MVSVLGSEPRYLGSIPSAPAILPEIFPYLILIAFFPEFA